MVNHLVETDYESSVSNLTIQLIDVDKLKEKGAEILSNLLKLPTAIKKDTTNKPTDTDSKINIQKPKEAIDNIVKDKLNNLFGGKKKVKDTVN